MGERKVLNKYYPPDFDPKLVLKNVCPRDRQYTVRLMAPFNMRCLTCGRYIYKATKFNARKETVQGEEYLGIKIFRFYIRCPSCSSEITFKTDPKNADYSVGSGATRNFDHWHANVHAQDLEARRVEAEESQNPMKALENRTIDSKREMDILDALEEIRDTNDRHAGVDPLVLIQRKQEEAARQQALADAEDEAHVARVFGRTSDGTVVRRVESDSDGESGGGGGGGKEDSTGLARKRTADVLVAGAADAVSKKKPRLLTAKGLSGLVRVKPKTAQTKSTPASTAESTPTPAPAAAPAALSALMGDYGSSSDDD